MKTIELTINGVLTTLTLDDVWDYCVSMWRWIAKEKRGNKYLSTIKLKNKWLKEHGFVADEIEGHCLFCAFHADFDCDTCPAVEIDPDFLCHRTAYCWLKKPIKFYNKVNYLRTKRNKS